MYNHILISTDGSEVAQKGVDHGLSLAKSLGAQVTIITVTERFPTHLGGIGFEYTTSDSLMEDYAAGQQAGVDAILAGAKKSADALGVFAETLHVSDSRPAEAIVEAARTRNCSLIAMASHGRRGLGRLILGSQTAEVVTNSPVPVLMVR